MDVLPCTRMAQKTELSLNEGLVMSFTDALEAFASRFLQKTFDCGSHTSVFEVGNFSSYGHLAAHKEPHLAIIPGN